MINKSKNNNKSSTDFNIPCFECMNYLTEDIRQKSGLRHSDKMEILFYLQHISDRKVVKEIINLLKNISSRY